MESLESWKVDPERSTLGFRLPHALLGEIGGQFGCWGGRLRVDATDVRRSAVRIWVELASLTTGSRRRDEEILGTELFDQLWEPAVEFDGESVEIDPSDRVSLRGWLSLRALRKRVSIAIEAPAIQVDPSGTPRLVCTARASIDRRALGLRGLKHAGEWLNDQLLGGTIEVVAHVEAVRESALPGLFPQGALDGLALAVGPSPAASGVPVS